MTIGMSIFIFIFATIAWIICRNFIKITEIGMRVFWIVTILSFCVPSFLGIDSRPEITYLFWPFIAGLMVGERSIHILSRINERNAKEAQESGIEIPEYKKINKSKTKKRRPSSEKKEH